MANFYLNLPAPAANGAGAWTLVSDLGFEKTIVVGGNVRATINIEASTQFPFQVDDGPSVATFLCPEQCQKTVYIGAAWMRVVVSDYKSGTPTVFVGGNDDGISSANLNVTAGDGVGVATDISALGSVQKTVFVMSQFRGSAILELSEDNVTWAQGPTFVGGLTPTPAYLNFQATAKFLRVRRQGVPVIAPGLPVVDVAIIRDVNVPPSFDDPELIRYTATGAEGSSFTVTLANTRDDADYFVSFMSQSLVAASGISKTVLNIPRGSRTTTQFVVNMSAPVEAGDQFEFLVVG